METLSVLGAGTIGSLLVKAGLSQGYRVVATGRSERTLLRVKGLGAEAITDNASAVMRSDLVMISVKPQHFPELAKSIPRELWRGKTVISVMAGVRLDTLRKVMGGAQVFRAMPNVNAVVNMSTTAITGEGEAKELVDSLFRSLGVTYWVSEDMMDVWTALIGSGPAFISEIVDGLVLGAVSSGMPRDLAYSSVLDMLKGTAENLKNHKGHPVEVRDNVTTPAGTTIRGLKAMEERGVKAALIETVESSSRRASELGKLIDERIRRELIGED
ncbi:pyrroline-5-carboxylate reductase [Metallosphaera sedula]|uniref:Pyrroline-5-carboxylate reductase n=4 Tax=Metallosphaera TaxID=41980 RepID=A4YFE4_METS5|nr:MULTISPECIES: pyrroline-5-carboxylate reductase [Metallosphaera]ABP95146.1 pyrroline-5-carboxylate reductase [Metallosphaera sedula DSM 5348]AIM27132.1 pyrroline-5-carboxylate reductase [Metallosphaera sedula]AKV74037.1 pyrroline-5-carboxylate reductase [Metallosphaera sedula]AKV76276.1 pyrroline-5-carboxylate reductase [Metallosphaera sedula]AKV78528.1 pyrroline-5-carboxylate reductase [Metallosphaera sedula]